MGSWTLLLQMEPVADVTPLLTGAGRLFIVERDDSNAGVKVFPAVSMIRKTVCHKVYMFVRLMTGPVAAMFLLSCGDAMGGPMDDGKMIYMQRCFQCHGVEGKGDGPAAAFLPRRPRDFTAGLYKLKTSPPDTMLARDEDIFNAISEGLLANGMPRWRGTLTDTEIKSLVVYLKSLSDLFKGEPNSPELKMPASPRTPQTEKWGRKGFFQFKCNDCHGEDGRGNPNKILKDDYGTRIFPRDLTKPWTFIGPYTRQALYARVTNGIPVTPMPPHYDPKKEADLAQTRLDAVDYVMSLAEQAEAERRKANMVWAALMAAMAGGAYWLLLGRRSGKSLA
jgi:mono/diheme cytochrome c family protein